MYVKIMPDNTVSLEYDNQTLSNQIGGGWIEVVRSKQLPVDMVMVIDEEGKRKGMAHNKFGSRLYAGGEIVGPVILCKEKAITDEDGNPDGYDLFPLEETDMEDVDKLITQFLPEAHMSGEAAITINLDRGEGGIHISSPGLEMFEKVYVIMSLANAYQIPFSTLAAMFADREMEEMAKQEGHWVKRYEDLEEDDGVEP